MTALWRGAEMAWAAFVLRTILGFVYLFAGIHKIVNVGVSAYAQGLAMTDAARFLPAWVLTAGGTVIPFMEVTLGTLLLLGLWTRPVLRIVAVLICLITAGYGIHGLLHPIGATAMNVVIINTFILPRVGLVVVSLFMPADADWLSIDGLRRARARAPQAVAVG